MSNGVCGSCPHAVLDHEAKGCISCSCLIDYRPAEQDIEAPEVTVPVTSEPDPTPEPVVEDDAEPAENDKPAEDD